MQGKFNIPLSRLRGTSSRPTIMDVDLYHRHFLRSFLRNSLRSPSKGDLGVPLFHVEIQGDCHNEKIPGFRFGDLTCRQHLIFQLFHQRTLQRLRKAIRLEINQVGTRRKFRRVPQYRMRTRAGFPIVNRIQKPSIDIIH